MSSHFQAGLSAGCVTGIGSLPFTDPEVAVAFVAQYAPELPFWPQLPRRAAGEGMIAQAMGELVEYLELCARPYGWSVRQGAESAFAAALDRKEATLSHETAAGFFALEHAIRSGRFPAAKAVKAQIEGPVTLTHGLYINGTPASRIAGWLERLTQFLERQIVWQVHTLRELGLPVLILLDEPALALEGGVAPPLSFVTGALHAVLQSARQAGASVGLHCCVPLPIDHLAQLELDLLSFDANLPIPGDPFLTLARGILDRGGLLAFGLAPTGPSSATVESMTSRWLALASAIGDPTLVASQSLVTAACGLGLSTLAETDHSFLLARHTGQAIREFVDGNSSE